MGNYEELKAAVAAVIKTNGMQEITGDVMQNALLTIISTVGGNATFAGVATPETNPGTPDANVFYLATEPGIYAYFGGVELTNEVLLFANKNGSWARFDSGIATFAKIEELENNMLTAEAVLLGRTIDSTNLIAKQNPIFVKDRYFSPSEGWTDRKNYDCHIWIEVEPNTQYYCLGNAAEFDENKEYLNLYHNPSGPTMASVTSFISSDSCKYVVLSYPTTPQYIQPGTEYTNGYWITEINGTQSNKITDEYLDIETNLKKSSILTKLIDPIYDGCKMVESHGDIINFTQASVVANAEIQNASVKMFSDDAKRCCGIKADTDSYIRIPTNIASWKSLTFVMYCPYDTCILTTGEHSGYLRMYLNSQGGTGYGTWFNGRWHTGWNFLTITKEEIAQNVHSITDIYIKFESRSSVVNGNKFAYVILDSIIVDLRVKPTILINFDQLWYESKNNGGYQKLYDNNIPATFFSKNYKDMIPEDIAYIKDFANIYGWELGSYSNVGETNGVIERATSYATAKESCEATIADFIDSFNTNVWSFAATQAQCNEIGANSILNSGYIGIRYGANHPMTYWNNECGGWVQHNDVSSMTLQDMKNMLDKCIEYGLSWAWFTHGVCADGEEYMLKNNSEERSTSSGVQLSVFDGFVDYLKSKIDDGLVQAITFKEFYRQCGTEVR